MKVTIPTVKVKNLQSDIPFQKTGEMFLVQTVENQFDAYGNEGHFFVIKENGSTPAIVSGPHVEPLMAYRAMILLQVAASLTQSANEY